MTIKLAIDLLLNDSTAHYQPKNLIPSTTINAVNIYKGTNWTFLVW